MSSLNFNKWIGNDQRFENFWNVLNYSGKFKSCQLFSFEKFNADFERTFCCLSTVYFIFTQLSEEVMKTILKTKFKWQNRNFPTYRRLLGQSFALKNSNSSKTCQWSFCLWANEHKEHSTSVQLTPYQCPCLPQEKHSSSEGFPLVLANYNQNLEHEFDNH